MNNLLTLVSARMYGIAKKIYRENIRGVICRIIYRKKELRLKSFHKNFYANNKMERFFFFNMYLPF